MSRQAADPLAWARVCMLPKRDSAIDYRRLLATLASRARWLGSRDPEAAAQESLRRSLENTRSQSAVEYYFSQDLPAGFEPPDWPLDQLFAWLHGVLYYVVREEHNRVGNRREVPLGAIKPERMDENSRLDPADPAPDPLEVLLQKELQEIVVDCFPMLEPDYRTVLRMRAEGLTYGQIALRLGENENTIATWVSRGIRALAQCVRVRTGRFTSAPQSAGARNNA